MVYVNTMNQSKGSHRNADAISVSTILCHTQERETGLPIHTSWQVVTSCTSRKSIKRKVIFAFEHPSQEKNKNPSPPPRQHLRHTRNIHLPRSHSRRSPIPRRSMIPRRRSLLPIAQRHLQIVVAVWRALPSPPGDFSRVLFDERAIVLSLSLSLSAVSRCIRFWWCIFRKMQLGIGDAAAVGFGVFVPRARVPPGLWGSHGGLVFCRVAFG